MRRTPPCLQTIVPERTAQQQCLADSKIQHMRLGSSYRFIFLQGDTQTSQTL